MSIKSLSPGEIVESVCTRCRTVTNHTIVAMVADRVVRVQCNTCGGVHNYRSAEKAGKAATASPKKPAAPRRAERTPRSSDRQEWEARIVAAEGKRPLPYDMQGRYRSDDLVEHPLFGLGLVVRLAGPNKIEVLFKDGRKLLRCG